MNINEEKLDRRAHWIQWLVTAVIIATGWCVRLEFTVNQLKTDIESQHKDRDKTIASLWSKFGEDHDQVTVSKTDIEWLKGNLIRPTNGGRN